MRASVPRRYDISVSGTVLRRESEAGSEEFGACREMVQVLEVKIWALLDKKIHIILAQGCSSDGALHIAHLWSRSVARVRWVRVQS